MPKIEEKTLGLTSLSKEDAESLKTAIDVAMTASQEVMDILVKLYPVLPAKMASNGIPKAWRDHAEERLAGKNIKPCGSLVGGIMTSMSAALDICEKLNILAAGNELTED